MMDLKVTPEALKQKADEVSKNISQMEKLMAEMESTVKKTEHYWIGEGGNTHRNAYNKRRDAVGEMLRRFKEHPRDLLTMAGIYEQAEAEVVELANELPGDVIS